MMTFNPQLVQIKSYVSEYFLNDQILEKCSSPAYRRATRVPNRRSGAEQCGQGDPRGWRSGCRRTPPSPDDTEEEDIHTRVVCRTNTVGD